MQFSASKAFSQAFQLLGASFGRLVAVWLTYIVGIIALFAAFGGMIFTLARSSMLAGGSGLTPGQSPFAGFGFSIILFYLLYFAIIFAQQLSLSRASTGREEDTYAVALGVGLRGTPTMIGVLLIYIVAGIAGTIVFSLFSAAIMASGETGAASMIIGLIAFVAIFYLVARLSLVLPVVAIGEERNPITAVATAWRLTAGSSLKIFVIWFLAIIAAFVIYMVAIAATVGLPGSTVAGAVPSGGSIAAMAIVFLVLGLSIGLYMVTLTTAIYDQLAPNSIDATAGAFE